MIAPLKTVTVFACGACPLRDGVEMVDPGGQNQNVGASFGRAKNVMNDLVEAVFISNESAVDLRHSTWGAGIGVAGVPESSRMQAKNRLRCE